MAVSRSIPQLYNSAIVLVERLEQEGVTDAPDHRQGGLRQGTAGASSRLLGLANEQLQTALNEREQARAELESTNRELQAAKQRLEVLVQQIERAHREQQFLADAGAILASTLDYDATLTSVARLVVLEFADVCFVDLLEENGQIRKLRAVSRDPALDWACEALTKLPLDRDQPYLGKAALSSKRTILMETLSSEMVDAFAQRNPERLRALRALGTVSALTVPLIAHNRIFGVLACIRCASSRHYRAEDSRLAEALAVRAALSIENARLYGKARHALQAREEVLGIVAHDLRNPLSAIVMDAGLLQRHPDGRTDFAESVAAIQQSAERMNRMIQDLLDVTRIEAGRLRIKPERLCVAQLLADTVQAQQGLAASASVDLRYVVADGRMEVWADRDRLLRVFENLIGNAVRFTAPGGRITITATASDGMVQFRVADTGTGISAHDLPRIFDRFWQSGNAENRGAGLGLAIVKGIIEAHGGRITVESSVGAGTTFSFTIPSAPALDPRRR